MNNELDQIRQRAQGLLFGLAAGDRNGGPLQMAVRVCESLIEVDDIDIFDILDRYLEWYRAGAFDTGPVAARVFELIDGGMAYDDAALRTHREFDRQTAGCNPAHRGSVLAMFKPVSCRDLPDQWIAKCAKREAGLTHCHDLAGDVSAATVVLCRHLILGDAWPEALRFAAKGRMKETQLALLPSEFEDLDAGGYSPEVLKAAISFLQFNDSFESALLTSLEFAGPANYCPVLVGAIGGARWGSSAVLNSGMLDPRLQPRLELLSAQLASRDC